MQNFEFPNVQKVKKILEYHSVLPRICFLLIQNSKSELSEAKSGIGGTDNQLAASFTQFRRFRTELEG